MNSHSGNVQPSLDAEEHSRIGGVDGKKVFVLDNAGNQIVSFGGNLFSSDSVKKYYANTGAVTDGVVWSPAAGKKWYVTDIFVGISTAATITLEDDLTAGDSIVWAMDAAANSGWSKHFATPLFSGENGADLLITTTA